MAGFDINSFAIGSTTSHSFSESYAASSSTANAASFSKASAVGTGQVAAAAAAAGSGTRFLSDISMDDVVKLLTNNFNSFQGYAVSHDSLELSLGNQTSQLKQLISAAVHQLSETIEENPGGGTKNAAGLTTKPPGWGIGFFGPGDDQKKLMKKISEVICGSGQGIYCH